MSLTSSYVIAAIMLARLILKKAPKVVSYALWAVAGFRLVFPISFESVFSLIPFKSQPIPQDIAVRAIPRIDSGINSVNDAVSRFLPAATPAASINPMQILLAAGIAVWLIGIAAMLIYSAVSIVLLKRRLDGAMPLEGNVYEAQNLKTPFVLGFIHPKIYIPTGLSAEEKGYIILHEQTHIKRFDHVVKLAAFLILCAHWFNPLAWLAFVLMSVDMEMSCDERVLKEMGGEIKKAYSTSLLSLATGRRLINGSPLAFGEGNIKGRIKNVLNFRKPAAWVIVVVVVLAAALSVGLAANRVQDAGRSYNFSFFEVNGIGLFAPLDTLDTSGLTPAEPLRGKNAYQHNFEEVRFDTDEKGYILRLHAAVYDGGATIPELPADGDIQQVISYKLETIEQAIIYLDEGESGWYDRTQRLRYMRYTDKERDITITFIYTENNADWHRLVFVDAQAKAAPAMGITTLTLDEIRALAQKSDALTFEDFKAFRGADASSNLAYHIMVYGVEGGYRLIVRTDGRQIDGASLESIWESGGSGIDIRYDDVDQFIMEHPSSPALTRNAAMQPAGWEDIHVGTPREAVLKMMGEPDYMLSGFYGDGYDLDGSHLIFYYDGDGRVQWIVKDGKRIEPPEDQTPPSPSVSPAVINFRVRPDPEKYTPLMSSTPGIRLDIAYAGPPAEILYEAETGGFLTWENSVVTDLRASTQQPIGSSPLYWRPDFETLQDDIITLTVLNEDGEKIAGAMLSITKREDGYFIAPDDVG